MACGIQIAKLINTLFNKEREKKKDPESYRNFNNDIIIIF